MTVEKLRDAALSLSDSDRLTLVRSLLDSLPEDSPAHGWAEAWANEIQARYDEYLRGEVVPIVGEQSLRELNADLQRMRRS